MRYLTECAVFERRWNGKHDGFIQIIGEPVPDESYGDGASIEVWDGNRIFHLSVQWLREPVGNSFGIIPLTQAARDMLALVSP